MRTVPQSSSVIDALMEMEARVNQEMCNRYRRSQIFANGSGGSNGNDTDIQQGSDSGASAFAPPNRPCTTEVVSWMVRKLRGHIVLFSGSE